nr:hypothetical protein [Tautonia rosea]
MEAVHDAGDAVFVQGDIEIEKESETEAGEAEVGKQLHAMDGGNLLDGLQFNKDQAVDDQIGAEVKIEFLVVIDHRNPLLCFDGQPSAFQFIHHRRLRHGLQQPRPQPWINRGCHIHDHARTLIRSHSLLPFALSPAL